MEIEAGKWKSEGRCPASACQSEPVAEICKNVKIGAHRPAAESSPVLPPPSSIGLPEMRAAVLTVVGWCRINMLIDGEECRVGAETTHLFLHVVY